MRFRARLLLATAAAGLAGWALGNPALGQEAPESLLPEGFGDPVPPAPVAPAPPSPAPVAETPGTPQLPRIEDEGIEGDEEGDEDDELGLEDSIFDEIPPEYELPPGARRSLTRVGPLTPARGGYGAEAFAGVDGRYLESLMRRLDAPGPSRWQHIALRRALLSRVPTPRGVSAPDWIAERAWLLLRMGEVDGARMLVQRVDSDRFTPKLYAVAMQVGLASADLASFCPLVSGARERAETPAWIMAGAICAGLAGDSVGATAQMSNVRRNAITNGFDMLLGDKAANAGTSSAGVALNWDNVERLNAWRFGIATALGEEIPQEMFSGSGVQVAAWRARAPTIELAERIAPARTAAVLGVLSNQALVSMYSALWSDRGPEEQDGTPADNLRGAYVRAGDGERVEAMRSLWEAENANDRYAGLILTARAAAAIEPDRDLGAYAGNLIASMLSAGLDIQAARWAGIVEDLGGEGDQAWALLAIGAPEPVVEASYGRLDDYASRAGSGGRHRTRMLAAALAGLGRLDAGDTAEADAEFQLGIDRENLWTRMLERAARLRRPGAVALIASVGMQSRTWRGVPPSHLYHIVRAYRMAGLEAEARMIAAEAVTRA